TVALGLAFGGRFPTDRRFHVLALALGLCNGAGLTAFINLGANNVSSGEASLIVYTQPLLVAVAARLWLGERGGTRRTLGLLIGFAGLVVVLSDSIRPGAHPAWFAYLELFGASLSWTAGTLLFKRVPSGANLVWLVCLQNLYGTIPLLIPLLLVRPERLDPTLQLTLLLALLAIVIGPFGWLIWLRLLERGEASVVSGNIFFVPLVAVLGGVIFLGERLHPLVIAGGVLIAAGIALVNRSAGNPPPSAHSSNENRARLTAADSTAGIS
ncbi:MAG: DMT family transporter, partial [Dehalococcoidia bacterium]